jgi:hypothetical protein
LNFKPKGIFVNKGKPKGTCFNYNEVGNYSNDWPKPKLSNGGYKIIAPPTNLVQGECNCFMFLKGKVLKWEVLCLLDIWASHNCITRNSNKRMELQMEEFKACIKVHFADQVPHPITL